MNISELSDEELMTMYQNGSEEAFKLLYDRHAARIYTFLKNRLSSRERLADIYQEVFVKIHKSKHLYNSSFPLMPWIFTVTRSVMLDELKKEKKHQNHEELPENLMQESLEPINYTALAQVSLLPEAQRSAITMRYFDEKTFEEIAQTLNTTTPNVRQIVSRGVKRLKELVKEGEKS